VAADKAIGPRGRELLAAVMASSRDEVVRVSAINEVVELAKVDLKKLRWVLNKLIAEYSEYQPRNTKQKEDA
jgi:hypothetical protein